jgi:hypothetical protein
MTTSYQDTSDSRRHSVQIKSMLDDLMRQVWRDIDRVHEPQAQILFQKTVEVLSDLKTAYEHYEAGTGKTLP